VCEVAGYKIDAPFPRLTYAEAMASYGSDKPDLRLPPFYAVQDLFPGAMLTGEGLPLVAIVVPKAGGASRKERDELKAYGAERGLRVYDDPKRLDRDYPGPMTEVRARTGATSEDLLILAGWPGDADPHRPEDTVFQACGQLRLFPGQKYAAKHGLLKQDDFRFLWVVDFPMFEWNADENRWDAAHHPFTSVYDEDIEKLTEDPAHCRAKSYDLVLNGTELASGSIRIHRRDIQNKVFRALGHSDESARAKFGFLLEALEYGAPHTAALRSASTGWS
jgi:aspartyl-tRNA synthetase